MKLFPQLATAAVQAATSRHILARYDEMMAEIKKDVFDSMDELHHLLSGFKALHTQQTYEGLIQIR